MSLFSLSIQLLSFYCILEKTGNGPSTNGLSFKALTGILIPIFPVSQERLRRLNHSVAKETARRRAMLDSGVYPPGSPSK